MKKSAWTFLLASLWALGFLAAVFFVVYVVCFASMVEEGQYPAANAFKPFAGEPAPIIHVPKWFFLFSFFLFLGRTKELRTLLDRIDVLLGFKINDNKLPKVRRQ